MKTPKYEAIKSARNTLRLWEALNSPLILPLRLYLMSTYSYYLGLTPIYVVSFT